MAVSLSSLRVIGDIDAAGHARGAAQKFSADQQRITAGSSPFVVR